MQSEIYHSISEIAKCGEICPAASFKLDRRGRRPRRPVKRKANITLRSKISKQLAFPLGESKKIRYFALRSGIYHSISEIS